MKAEEILSIDFSKYEKLMLDKIVITGAMIKAKLDKWDGVALTGFINNEYAFSSFYDKEDEIRIRELDDKFLVIAREGR